MQELLLAIDWPLIIEKAVLISIIIGISLFVAMYETYAERKVAAFIQDRRGPNRAGPFGIFQPLADGLKLFSKEEIVPNHSNRFLFILGPGLAMLTAMMTSAVIPWGGHIHAFGRNISLQIAGIRICVLLIGAFNAAAEIHRDDCSPLLRDQRIELPVTTAGIQDSPAFQPVSSFIYFAQECLQHTVRIQAPGTIFSIIMKTPLARKACLCLFVLFSYIPDEPCVSRFQFASSCRIVRKMLPEKIFIIKKSFHDQPGYSIDDGIEPILFRIQYSFMYDQLFACMKRSMYGRDYFEL